MAARILIVEDEAGLVTTLRDRLRKQGYSVSVARDGLSGLETAANEPFDLIILDLMMPGLSGLAVCEKLRQGGSSTPILMLTARRQTKDKVAGLKAGGDDYLTKPFQMAELLARIEALLRRPSTVAPAAPARYQFGTVRMDMRRTEVTRDGKPVPVSAKEFQLLRYFVEHRDATLSRDELLREVWGYGELPSTRTVDVHVAWLRQKLESDPKNPQYIVTVIGFGYKFAG
ncbi:MAG TPA: response regulator transcription factor [Candidatus Dormibacteraeota bacterium]|nr:response regulator transcription factor [Candidatus Dormibacteraeota bacterium]